MKNTLLLLLAFVSFTANAQDFAKDTLIGSTPASILKIKNHKIIIAQNKELSTSYVKQKDGSFISNGVPFIQIHIDQKKHVIGSTYDYIEVLFDNLGGNNDMYDVNNLRLLVHSEKREKEKKEQMAVFYPLSDRFLNLKFTFNYTDDDDRREKEFAIKDIVRKGLLVFENYYLTQK